MNGAHGAAAARLAVEATSRGRGSVKGLSLEENLALVILESISAAMTRDALVSGLDTINKYSLSTAQPKYKENRFPILSHLIHLPVRTP